MKIFITTALLLAVSLCTVAQPPNTAFVTIQNGKFFRHNQPYLYMGSNYWQGLNLAASVPGADRIRLTRELDQMKKCGILNLRILALTEGPDPSPYRILPAVQDEPGVLKETLLTGLDVLLDELRKRDLTAVVVLNNFWQWSGGMAQYVQWHTGEEIPYPPPHQNGDWNTFQQYIARFYTLPAAVAQFNEVLKKIVVRKNTINGILYREDPTIMAWELANEPRGVNQAAAMLAWIDQTAKLIKSIDTNHLVTTGAEGYTSSPESSGTDFIDMHSSPAIDYTTAHIWIQNWGWYDPTQHAASYPDAKKKMTEYLMRHAEESKRLGKPFVLEEFGIMRDNGSFDAAAPSINRDEYFRDVFEQVYQLAKRGEACGVNFWAWGGEGRPRHAGAWWQKGDEFTGDPPHEPQGWYSVYNTDLATLKIIKTYSNKLKKLR